MLELGGSCRLHGPGRRTVNGSHHQIRVHAAEKGLAILGDTLTAARRLRGFICTLPNSVSNIRGPAER